MRQVIKNKQSKPYWLRRDELRRGGEGKRSGKRSFSHPQVPTFIGDRAKKSSGRIDRCFFDKSQLIC